MAPGGDDTENRPAVGRVEAFSDGVIAIIITIMVLEMHPPEHAGWAALWSIWPVLLAYVLSYLQVAIYWANHHRLFSHATVVTNGLVWSNMAVLFCLSLIPFATAYLGDQHFSRDAVIVYLVVLLLPSIAYGWLQSVIRRTGSGGSSARFYYEKTIRKGRLSTLIYALGIALTFVTPWAGIVASALVSILWILPLSPLDRMFVRD